MYRWLGLVVVTAGCFRPDSAAVPCGDGWCPAPLTCVAEVCQAATDAEAGPDARAIGCGAGDVLLLEGGGQRPCPLGCTTTPDPHCLELAPSNGLDPALLAGTGTLIIDGDTLIDTSTGTLSGAVSRAGFGVDTTFAFEVSGPPGEEVAVLRASTLIIERGTIIVEGSIPLVLLARELQVGAEAIVDVSARCSGPGVDRTCPGPGGGTGAGGDPLAGERATGCGPGDSAELGSRSGGGGGGHGGGGGRGGRGNAGPSTPGGLTCAGSELEPLRGGSGGGGSTLLGPTDGRGQGGGGGGAIQLTALEQLSIAGRIRSHGRGGAGGGLAGIGGGGGGGGGAGGGVLLEAITCDLAGAYVAANGGGGGGGTQEAATSSQPGADGSDTPEPAKGGDGAAPGGDGGAGGAGTSPGGADGAATAGGALAGGGGGGGGAGVIVTRCHISSGAPTLTSPAPIVVPVRTR